MALLIGAETREVRSVVLKFGNPDNPETYREVPAKLYAKSLLPQALQQIQQLTVDAQGKVREEERLNRSLRVLNKRFKEQLEDDSISAAAADKTKLEIEAKEAELIGNLEEAQKFVDEVEAYLLEAVADIDIVKPREGLSDDETAEVIRLDKAGTLDASCPLVEKVEFTKETMRELCGDVRGKGVISIASINFFQVVMESVAVKKQTASGSAG